MSGTARASRSTTPRKAAGASKRAATSPNASKRSNAKQPAKQTGARRKAPAKPPAKPPADAPAPATAPRASELTESASKAVERALGLVTMTPRRAVMVASVRALAAGLDLAEAGDRPKITRELDRLMGVLMADANPIGEPPDWTEQTAGAPA